MEAQPISSVPVSNRVIPIPRVRNVTILISAVRGRVLGSERIKSSRVAVISSIVLFVLLQCGLNWGIQQGAIPVQDPVFVEKIDLYRRWAQDTASNRSSVLALGSSRTQLAFDAGRLAEQTQARAFNFGCSAAGPLTCSLYWRRLLNEPVPRPSHVFIELHPGFLSPIDPPFESRWLHSYRLRPDEVTVLHQHGWQAPVPQHHGWRGWLASSYYFRFALLNRYSPKLLPCPFGLTVGARSDDFGFVGGIDLEPGDQPRALRLTHEQYAPAFPGYLVGGAGPNAIRDILAQAEDHRVKAALVLMPESSEFRSWYGKAGYESITRFATEQAAEHNVPLFDAREWLADSLIADGHHLSSRGAEVFTARLAQEASEWLRARR